jgi:hypothetical protein
MFYHTPGGWILAFEQEMNSLLAARSGPIGPEGLRYQAAVCTEHPDCVFVRFESQRDHVPWKDQMPEAAAQSLLNRLIHL